MNIGIVGLGLMGSQIALQLIRSGHEVTAWNRTSDAVEKLVAAGVKRASSVADALQGDVALIILFDDAAIRTTLLDSGSLARGNTSCIYSCMSTISMTFANELEDAHATHGLRYAAAPMSGRPDVIEKHGLNVLAAGDAATLDTLEIPFGLLGKMWRIGSRPTDANIAKLSANFMIAAAIEAMSEAAPIIAAYGADPETFLSTMAQTLFSAPIYRVYAPTISGDDPARPSGLTMPLKDIGNMSIAAKATGIGMPFCDTIRTNLMRASETGDVDKDWATALARIARHVTGRESSRMRA